MHLDMACGLSYASEVHPHFFWEILGLNIVLRVIPYYIAKVFRLDLVSPGHYRLSEAAHLLMTDLVFDRYNRRSEFIDDFLDCRASLLICHATSLEVHQALDELVVVFPALN